MLGLISRLVTHVENIIVDYIDLDFTLWLTWMLTPLIITFLLPLIIVLLLYLSALNFYVYKLHRHRLRHAYETDFWDGARKTAAAVWDAHGWIWHGWSIICEAMKVIPGTVQICSNILKENNLLAISPGGVYEAQFGDAYYRLMWKKRLGFAKVALDAKVPVIPVFTQNLREAFRSVGFGKRLWLKLYTITKLPFVPIYGGFPVKLRTHVGKPIPYDGNLTPEQLHIKVAHAIEELIEEHQRIPGSIMRALVERVYELPKKKSK
ncbi:transmembrane protein 68 isoform X3 [Cryptotermes secundus]|uniref:transmembrane protein 68 isoform X3 n=1 Tax=Cryptotermes secundus TaxID=105785 RepID=UPI000CD7C8EE|nr:transmembrane protein 68 isoform X3 [Cryptotermes secundus]